MSPLLAPFQLEFMQQAMLAAGMVGAVCAFLSCFLVLKGWSLMGDAISHAVFPGIVIAYMAGLPLAVGAFATGLLCAVATGYIRENSRVKEDTVLGIVFTGLFALGLVLFTKVETDLHLNHILFGHLLGITDAGLRQTLWLGGGTLAVILALRRDLLLYCFDPAHALSVGIQTRGLYYLLLALLSTTIVTSLQTVGILLVISMLITPGCTAYLLTDRFERMLVIASASAVCSGVGGAYISFFIDGSMGACIVLVQALIFLFALLLAPRHGLLARLRSPLRPATS
ncbi:MAG: metal ABC transporter permease [Verrucomicrobiae bacterium]|nr:metal ABC transporter permease [Verrucomicrobiae bacterium]